MLSKTDLDWFWCCSEHPRIINKAPKLVTLQDVRDQIMFRLFEIIQFRRGTSVYHPHSTPVTSTSVFPVCKHQATLYHVSVFMALFSQFNIEDTVVWVTNRIASNFDRYKKNKLWLKSDIVINSHDLVYHNIFMIF